MKAIQNFGFLFFLLIIGQVILCNYTQLGPYIMLSMLPTMILCLPTKVSTIGTMLIAMASGFMVDWLADGLLGLNTAAILPVAFVRKEIIRIFLGEDLITREERFSYRKQGFVKVSIAQTICSAIFLALYIILDGAGTRTGWFCIGKFLVSMIFNFFLAIIVINILAPDDRK